MAKDPKEYGYEGEMAMSQLKGIMMHAKQLHDKLEPSTDLPEWVQSKITLAYDYMQTAADYMSTEMNEEVEELDELSKDTLKSYLSKAGSGKQYSNPQHFRSSMLSQDTAKAKLGRKSRKDVKVKASKTGTKLPLDPDTNTPDYFTAALRRKRGLPEEAPANAVGSGNIAGMGVGPDGEPGVTPAATARYKRKNKQEEPKAGRKSFSIFMKGK